MTKDEKRQGAERNVIDMQTMRKRMKEKERKQEFAHQKSRRNHQVRWYHYLQFIFFMGLLALFMRQCQGGGAF